MKFLVDTNILIPLEPASEADVCPQCNSAVELHRTLLEAGHKIFVHPASKEDLSRDKDTARRRFREIHFAKYPLLNDPPSPSSKIASIIGSAASRGSNDWVDNQLLSAVFEDAVDFLISEDRRLRSKAKRLGIEARVLTIEEAHSLTRDLSGQVPIPLPSVQSVKTYSIRADDPILDSFRADYPDFDAWFSRCRRQHRQSFIIPGDGDYVAGFCILKDERDPPLPLTGKVLKLCSFKISEKFNGFRYGELLLRALFQYADQNRYDWIFSTVFDRYDKLMELFSDFGFAPLSTKTELGELVMAKPIRAQVISDETDPIEYLIRYGPFRFVSEVDWFVIPIQPMYSNVLFPETVYQSQLFQGVHPFGNSIRKAYLCHSQIGKLPNGSVLAFYRSQQHRGIIAIGVVENTIRSSSPEAIIHAVGKRTVYSMNEIQELCRKPVLAILFRQTRGFHPEKPLKILLEGGVFRRPPQSITSIPREGVSCLREILA